MPKVFYRKLVRDKMPQVVREDGNKAEFRLLNDAEFRAELKRKLQEEVNEYDESDDVRELADVLAVVQELANFHGGMDSLKKVEQRKLENRGGFKQRLFMVWAEFTGDAP